MFFTRIMHVVMALALATKLLTAAAMMMALVSRCSLVRPKPHPGACRCAGTIGWSAAARVGRPRAFEGYANAANRSATLS